MEDANWSINTAVASTSSVDLFLMNRIGQIQNTVEQLAKENTRLKKRQRESDSLMLELQRSQLMPGLDSSKLRITMPQAHLGGRVAFRGGDRSSSENTMLELWWCFPFLKDYDMTRRPFVATDLRKPVWVLNMDNSCVPFANPHFCDMMGYSLYELCENKSVASMNTADRLKFRLLMNNYREPFGVSDIMAFEMEFMDKQGNMIKLAIQCQIFFKDDAQARYSVMCADQVLGSRPPPWAMLEALGLPQQELTPEEERQRMSLYRQQTYRREKQEWNDLSQVLGLGPPWAPWPCVPPAIEQLPQQPQALVTIQQLPSFITERVGQEGEDREDHQLFSPAPTSPF